MALDIQPLEAKKLDLQPLPLPKNTDVAIDKPKLDIQPVTASAKLDIQPAAKPLDIKPAQQSESIVDTIKKIPERFSTTTNLVADAGKKQMAEAGDTLKDQYGQPEADDPLTAIMRPLKLIGGAIDRVAAPAAGVIGATGLDPELSKNIAEIPAMVPLGEEKIATKIPKLMGDETPQVIQKGKEAAQAVQHILSPTSSGERAKAAEQGVRTNFGDATRSSAIADTKLADYEALANKMTPEEQGKFYNYVETRSQKGKSAPAALSPEHQAFADTLRTEFQKRRDALENLDKTEKMGFIEDYFPHMWKDAAKAKAFAADWVSRFGSGRSTNKRSIPTIEDGLKAGLQLAEPNPARAASNYVNSMDRHIATVQLLQDARKQRDAIWSNSMKAPREGWVPLDGPMTRKPAREIIPEGSNSGEIVRIGEQRLWAPPGFARVYNNFASKGLEATAGKPIYEAARELKNTWTAATLALSGYHFGTIIAEQLGTDIGRVMKNVIVRDFKGAGQAIKNIASIPLVVKSRTYQVGKKLKDQYTGRFDHGMDFEDMADHFAKSGGSFKIDPVYQASKNKDDFLTAYQKGTLGSDLKAMGAQAKSGPLGSVKATVDLAARAADTISAPLFKRYIPTIKAGAFSDLMGDWLRQHPGATDAETAAARVHYQDIVEERFGEMNNDNLFWNQTLKQTLGLLLTARTWDLGLVRQVAGPFVDLAKFAKGGFKDSTLTDRGFGLAGLLAAMLGMNGAYQYLKTGELPQNAEDWRAPRTGGMVDNVPERVDLPGRLREVKQLLPIPGKGPLSGVKQESYNKLSGPTQGAINAVNGTDPYPNDIPGVPISIGALMQGKRVGSKIGAVESLLGIRAAPFRELDPQTVEDLNKRKDLKAERMRLFLDALHKQQYPDDVRN